MFPVVTDAHHVEIENATSVDAFARGKAAMAADDVLRDTGLKVPPQHLRLWKF